MLTIVSSFSYCPSVFIIPIHFLRLLNTRSLHWWVDGGSAGLGGLKSRWCAPKSKDKLYNTNIASNEIRCQITCWTSSTPWIKPTISEHYLRWLFILNIINTSKMIECIIIIRHNAVSLITITRVLVIVKLWWVIHVLDTISTHGHCLITTC